MLRECEALRRRGGRDDRPTAASPPSDPPYRTDRRRAARADDAAGRRADRAVPHLRAQPADDGGHAPVGRPTSWAAQLSVPMRAREIVIDRTCARCGCEYEWGVHVRFFAERVGLTAGAGRVARPRRPGRRVLDRRRASACLIALVDQLHDTNDVDDRLWAALAARVRRRRSCSTSCCCAAGTTPSASWAAPRGSPTSRARPASPTWGEAVAGRRVRARAGPTNDRGPPPRWPAASGDRRRTRGTTPRSPPCGGRPRRAARTGRWAGSDRPDRETRRSPATPGDGRARRSRGRRRRCSGTAPRWPAPA